MATNSTQYDLVFCGTNRQGAERVEALAKLAHWMQVQPDDLGRVLEERGRLILEHVDTATATRAEGQLAALGIRSNLRPSNASGLSLELVPKEKPATVIACPACGQVHKAKGDQPAPLACAKCGIIFAKYEKAAQEKSERERIRQSLLSEQQRRQEQEQKELEERQALERRRQLEEQVRRELGLPRLVTSRTRLIGSAASLYLLGITSGIGGLYGYDWLSGSGKLAAGSDLRGGAALGFSQIGGQVGSQAGSQAGGEAGGPDPGVAAAMQVAALLAAAPGSGTPASGSAAAGPAAEGTIPARTPAAPGFLEGRLADLATDAEWDLYILSRIHDLQQAGATARAVALVDYLRNPDLRLDRGARLAGSLWQDGQSTDAEGLYLRLSAAAERLPDTAGARVAAYCTLARLLNRVGRATDADRLLHQANTIAATVGDPADRAAADSQIAALLSDLGRHQDARAYFQAATQGLSRIAAPADRLSAIPALARGFAKAGHRAAAVSFMEDATKGSESVTDARERARVLGLIAETSGALGDLEGARVTAAQIPGQGERDRTLYHILGQELAAGRLANAMDLTQDLRTPAYRALAFGLLGLRQQQQPAYRGLARESTAQAAAAIAAITDPAHRAAVMAEVGRFAARGGDTVAADPLFADAHQLTEATPFGSERDQLLATLATNEALALRLTDARQTAAKITDAPLRLALTGDLRGLTEAAAAAAP